MGIFTNSLGGEVAFQFGIFSVIEGGGIVMVFRARDDSFEKAFLSVAVVFDGVKLI